MIHPSPIPSLDGDGEIFPDGNMTDVVRRGDTVIRRRGRWSSASHAVLEHLDSAGFAGAPRLLAVEGEQEVVTFVAGSSAPPDLAGFASDDVLVAVARLIRKLHDAVASFVPDPGIEFPKMPGSPEGAAFVCHNDLAPWNTIFRRRRPQAFIDWDLVTLAPRTWDLAYAAWRFVPLYPDDARFGTTEKRGRRLRLFLDSYDLRTDERRDFVSLIRQRQVSGYETVEQWGRARLPGFDRLFDRRLHVGALDDIHWLDANAPVLADAIVP